TQYTYDSAGNILSKESSLIVPEERSGATRIVTAYVYGIDNRLLSLSEQKWTADSSLAAKNETYRYDARGRLVQRIGPEETILYQYDSLDKLIRYVNGPLTISYAYDAYGNRLYRSVNQIHPDGNAHTRYTQYLTDPVSGISRVLLEKDGDSGEILHRYTWGDRLISDADQYYLQDGLGSTVGLVESSGLVKGSYQYDAFGSLLTTDDPFQTTGGQARLTTFGYTGEEYDPETGLVYLRARYYDPSLGRFLTRDPVRGNTEETQSHNPYAYVQNNPVNYVDPTGMFGWGLLWSSVKQRIKRKLSTTIADKVLDLGIEKVPEERESGYGPNGQERNLLEDILGIPLQELKKGLRGDYMPSSLGGIAYDQLNQGANSYPDIMGAAYDSSSRELLLLADPQSSQTSIPWDYLVTALRVYGLAGRTPSVSIDFVLDSNGRVDPDGVSHVTLTPGLENTELGRVLFEADRMLKVIGVGRDNETRGGYTTSGLNITESYIASQIPGFKNQVTLLAENPVSSPTLDWRTWFSPGEMDLIRSDSTGSFIFASNSVQVNAVGNFSTTVTPPGAAAFANFFSAHYDEFASLYPALAKLKQAMKAIALAKFIRDHNIPVDGTWLTSANVQPAVTPSTTPNIESDPRPGQYSIINGGVLIDFNNSNFRYLSDTQGEAARLSSDTLTARPDDLSTSWQVSHDGKLLNASVMPLAPSLRTGSFQWMEAGFSEAAVGDFSLEWNLFYDSFSVNNVLSNSIPPVGFGWSYLPYELQFLGLRYYQNLNGFTRNVYRTLQFYNRSAGAVEEFALAEMKADGGSVYRKAGSTSGVEIILNADQTFVLSFAGGNKIHFLADGKPQILEDANHNTIRYFYDAIGRLDYIEDVVTGRRIALSYDANNQLVEARGASGTITYGYGGPRNSNLALITDNRTGKIRGLSYDDNHRLLSIEDHSNNSAHLFVNTYDAMGRVTSATDAQGNRTEIHNDMQNLETVYTNGVTGAVTRYNYDSLFRVTRTEDALGNVTTYTYGAVGKGPGTIRDARGNITRFEYNSLGNVVRKTDPLGNVTRYEYALINDEPRLIFEEGPDGTGRYMEYDSLGNVTRVMSGARPIRDGNGNLTGYYPTSTFTQSSYDTFGNLISMSDYFGVRASYNYDSFGNLISSRDALGNETVREYDSLSRLIRIRDPEGRETVMSYAGAGSNLSSVTTDGMTVRHRYDSRDRLIETEDALG
ncbi:MAG: RHS repeat-associated core domain-containing protein, partial [Candidatus Omnitrophica bacterium]|nr:RHS repeat-associated core domain-containing protein [Candidatus Omnitrophota bacterium]